MSFHYAEEVPVMLSPLSSSAPRAVEMEQLYPGVEFLPYKPTQLEITIAEQTVYPTLIYPRAIMPYEDEPMEHDSAMTALISNAFEVAFNRAIGHVTFTTLKFVTGFSFPDLFKYVLGIYYEDRMILRLGMDLYDPKSHSFVYTKIHKLTTWEDRHNDKWKEDLYRG